MICGDLGRINFYDLISKERIKKIDLGDIFLTSLAKSQSRNFIAAGNNNGDVYVVNVAGNKDHVVSLKPHYKLVRDLEFV